MSSPTEKSLKYLRKAGYIAAVVERWNPHSRTRHDLFGCIDLLAVGHGETLAIQATSRSNVTSRKRKLLGTLPNKDDKHAAEQARIRRNVKACLEAGWIVAVYGFSKDDVRPRVEFIRTSDFSDDAA